MTWIKLCGFTVLEEAQAAIGCGADALGFNFYKQSRRYIQPAAAQTIIRQLPKTVQMAGIFVDNEPVEIEQIARMAPLDTLQFHGQFDPPKQLLGPQWKTFAALRIAKEEAADGRYQTLLLRIEALSALVDRIIFDYRSPGGTELGGTGKQIPQAVLDRLANDGLLHSAVISGGLTPENVAEVVRRYRPFGVDAASGIETAPGRKDPEKMRRFVEAVRSA